MSAQRKEPEIWSGNNFDGLGPLTPEMSRWWREYGRALTAARRVMDFYQPLVRPYCTGPHDPPPLDPAAAKDEKKI
jgi:hypothetical protein